MAGNQARLVLIILDQVTCCDPSVCYKYICFVPGSLLVGFLIYKFIYNHSLVLFVPFDQLFIHLHIRSFIRYYYRLFVEYYILVLLRPLHSFNRIITSHFNLIEVIDFRIISNQKEKKK